MKKICQRPLNKTEINNGILTLSIDYRNKFPAPKTEISFVDENGREAGRGTMHSSGNTRIDSLTWWYKRYPDIAVGTRVGIYKDDNDNYMFKLENDMDIDETPSEKEGQPNTYEEDITSLSLEKDLEKYLSKRLDILENGLRLVESPQYPIDYEGKRWLIDILAKDKNDNLVIIELKAGIAKEAAYAQISKYIAVLKKTHPDAREKKVRGIIVASEFDIDLKLAVSNMSDILLLKKYNIDFRFEDIQ